jgi:hypothetical protein
MKTATRYTFCCDCLSRICSDDLFTFKLVFSDEATFHLSGNVNQHNLRIWESESPCAVIRHTRDSPTWSVSCTMLKNKVFMLIFFTKWTLTGIVYLDILEQYLMPILQEESCSDKMLSLARSEWPPRLPFPRQMGWQGQACHLAISFTLPISPWLFLWGTSIGYNFVRTCEMDKSCLW